MHKQFKFRKKLQQSNRMTGDQPTDDMKLAAFRFSYSSQRILTNKNYSFDWNISNGIYPDKSVNLKKKKTQKKLEEKANFPDAKDIESCC